MKIFSGSVESQSAPVWFSRGVSMQHVYVSAYYYDFIIMSFPIW